MDFALYRSGESNDWPYYDLVLRSPACPLCRQAAMLLVAPTVHPQAFCTEEACKAFTWDPTVHADELLTNAETIADAGWTSEPWGGP